ncbi:heterokaryon incompatibility protein-domain-containing protein [Hygrophoropsis aurantiaca]|uniref:Heterokaryon incompatibility protein-domain-containing protein n=1 Tax=Hygrophoropsis aurantiaca TaxID=72124 RepID=A0ACB7ZXG7_9AGAM|nr:heterokaryon incompatibility protein-domain-containing protein [Hygrophoropsis aurantiaca]
MAYVHSSEHSRRRVASHVDAYLASHDPNERENKGSEVGDPVEEPIYTPQVAYGGYPRFDYPPAAYPPAPYPQETFNSAGFQPPYPAANHPLRSNRRAASYAPAVYAQEDSDYGASSPRYPPGHPLATLSDIFERTMQAALAAGRGAGQCDILEEWYHKEQASVFQALLGPSGPPYHYNAQAQYQHNQPPVIVVGPPSPQTVYVGQRRPSSPSSAGSRDTEQRGRVSINPVATQMNQPPFSPTSSAAHGVSSPNDVPSPPTSPRSSNGAPRSPPPSAKPSVSVRPISNQRPPTSVRNPVASSSSAPPVPQTVPVRHRSSSVAERPLSPEMRRPSHSHSTIYEVRQPTSRRNPGGSSPPWQRVPVIQGGRQSPFQPVHSSHTATYTSPGYGTQTMGNPFDGNVQTGCVNLLPTTVVIKEILEDTLASMPLRLFNTKDGKMYSQKELIAAFWTSEQCKALLLLTTPQLAQTQTLYIKEVVRKYFEYAMLSHRWEDEEPMFRDIQGDIFSMTEPAGIKKVQKYCRTAEFLGFQWAWSDTCCIDKGSSADQEESIASMFLWYRNSAITIVYLSDVNSSSSDALKRSLWFTRGWTLQELLAPRFIQFYKADWTLYSGGPEVNHKNVDRMLDLLETATGVGKKFIINFSPGVENARARLRWAYKRKTAKEEDIAYSLMGIFDIQIPVVYGEKAKAFGRLLTEIVGRSGDITLFDWVGQGSRLNTCLPAHPKCYYDTAWLSGDALSGRTVSVANSPRNQNLEKYPSLYRLLVDPPPVRLYFTQGKLTVNCIVHKVETLKFHYESIRRPGIYRYDISADGLKSFSINTGETIAQVPDDTDSEDENIIIPTYTVVRLWHPDVLYDAQESGAPSDPLLSFQQLTKPFIALLLMRQGTGNYRRVPTRAPILAMLKNPDNIESITSDISSIEIS